MRTNTNLFIAVIAITFVFTSCKKDKEDPSPVITGPATYNFLNVDYSGQATRQDMLDEILTEMEKGTASGTIVSAQKLKDMYANQNGQFSSSALNSSGLQLKDQVYSRDQLLFEKYIDSVAVASQSTVAASKGVAGRRSDNSGTETYLLSANGIDYVALTEKNMMGALFYYQVTNNYLSDAGVGNTVDNTTIVTGQGTAMQHHWDEGFGYFGVPLDFPGNTNNVRFWGGYSTEVDHAIGSNSKLMNAFTSGRISINNGDLTTKNQQRDIILSEWEKLVAASAIHELNEAVASSDQAVLLHVVSEGIGFITSLKYNPNKKITQVQIDTILGYFGTNLYDITVSDINKALNDLSAIYGFDSFKSQI